jgi:hypothetical protein
LEICYGYRLSDPQRPTLIITSQCHPYSKFIPISRTTSPPIPDREQKATEHSVGIQSRLSDVPRSSSSHSDGGRHETTGCLLDSDLLFHEVDIDGISSYTGIPIPTDLAQSSKSMQSRFGFLMRHRDRDVFPCTLDFHIASYLHLCILCLIFCSRHELCRIVYPLLPSKTLYWLVSFL